MRELLAMVLAGMSGAACADVAGVYHPYVDPGEREVEYAFTDRDGDALHALSFGFAWNDRVAIELYALREFATHESARVRGQELEAIVQLTEQGEYASDWGLLFEVERAAGGDHYEMAVGLLWEKEIGGRWVAAANGLIEYEAGDETAPEFETALRAQLRYRAGPALEPAFELYLDDLDRVAGPALQGAWRLGQGRQLRWQAGLLFGLGSDDPDQVLRTAVEVEF